MDKLTGTQRSVLMSHVRSKDTGPELVVRKMIHGMGFRYRLHTRALPGCPDLVFPGPKKVVFVHGCFWHGHTCRAGRNRPASNIDYWNAKLERTRERDQMTRTKLQSLGWGVLSVWECETREARWLSARIKCFLEAK